MLLDENNNAFVFPSYEGVILPLAKPPDFSKGIPLV